MSTAAARRNGLMTIAPEPQPGRTRSGFAVRMVLGLAATGLGAAAFAYLPAGQSRAAWGCTAGAGFLTGFYLVVSGLAGRHTGQVARSLPDEQIGEVPDESDILLPMLGALLVYKFQFLTEARLHKALEVQHKQGRNRRLLGDVLLDMGFVTSSQLRKALDYQQEYLRQKRAAADLDQRRHRGS